MVLLISDQAGALIGMFKRIFFLGTTYLKTCLEPILETTGPVNYEILADMQTHNFILLERYRKYTYFNFLGAIQSSIRY